MNVTPNSLEAHSSSVVSLCDPCGICGAIVAGFSNMEV